MSLRGKVAVVTGAEQGLGRAIAYAYAGAHIDVGLLGRGAVALEAARHDVEQQGARALPVNLDVADADQVADAARTIETRLGPYDVWVNAATVELVGPTAETPPEEVRRVAELTYVGTVNGTLTALRRLRERGRGTIVNVVSPLALRGVPLHAAASGAEHAIRGFTAALRAELRHEGSPVRMVLVHLPAVDTPTLALAKSRLAHRARPLPPVWDPEVAARAVLRAARRGRGEVDVGVAPRAARLAALVPGLLADGAWARLTAGVPEDPLRPHDLWQPVAGDPGVRGPAGEPAAAEALVGVARRWATANGPAVARALAVAGAAALLAGLARRAAA
jgi:NAD(P)-dependent dehydrogenase (short-subunit alcohol dehydrogenase family)